MNCLIEVDHDDFYEEILQEVVINMRTDHQCGECGEKIIAGEQHELFVGELNGTHVHRTCMVCRNLRNKFLCSWTYEGIYNNIHDALDNTYDEIENCILLHATKYEYNKLVKFIPYLDDDTEFEDDDDEDDDMED